ncbi:MAG: hypothetical protein M3Y06_08760 [Actinomycetota bacterium]|nr:hypothetical protein [Actinomycetota bacterium]
MNGATLVVLATNVGAYDPTRRQIRRVLAGHRLPARRDARPTGRTDERRPAGRVSTIFGVVAAPIPGALELDAVNVYRMS